MKKIILSFLPFAVAVTLMSFLVYVVVQQDLRQSANDPQIGMANDVVDELIYGNDPATLLPSQLQADPRQSTSPFVNIYDDGGRPLASGVYGSSLAELPKGVLDYTRIHGSDIFTWEPISGLRIAAVLIRYKPELDRYYTTSSGFVLAGKSLRDVEMRESNLAHVVFVLWSITMSATFLAVYFKKRFT